MKVEDLTPKTAGVLEELYLQSLIDAGVKRMSAKQKGVADALFAIQQAEWHQREAAWYWTVLGSNSESGYYHAGRSRYFLNLLEECRAALQEWLDSDEAERLLKAGETA